MKLDFLICGSATDAFFSQIAFFRLCLNALGGVYSDARLVAVFGDHEVAEIPFRWKGHFDAIEVEWTSASREEGESVDPYFWRHYKRFSLIRDDASLGILCDADVAVLNPFDTLIGDLISRPALAGVIAHFHHFALGGGRDPHVDWSEISKAIIGRDIERPYRYTLTHENDPYTCPFYINYGVLIGTPDLMKEFYFRAVRLEPKIYRMTKSFFVPQITVPLVCADLKLPTLALPMRYNFPNDDRADAMYPEEMVNIKFLHYLRTQEFDRHKIFSDETCFDEFIKRGMTGSNEVFRRHVLEITKGRYPFFPLPRETRDENLAKGWKDTLREYGRWMRSRQSIRKLRDKISGRIERRRK